MFGTWILFGVTVLIAVYSGITFFSNINNRHCFSSVLILAIIELFVFIA